VSLAADGSIINAFISMQRPDLSLFDRVALHQLLRPH
jgi:hypothetical protein